MPKDNGTLQKRHRSPFPISFLSHHPWFTTAADPIVPPLHKRLVLLLMMTGYAALWGCLAIAPTSRVDWLLENLLVIPFMVLLVRWAYLHPLSDTACLATLLFLSMHAVGAHYTYSKVPAGFWFQDLMQLERNHFDRAAHFVFGLLFQYPFREAFFRHTSANSGLSALLAFACVTSAGAIYEIIEWFAAMVLSPDTAMAFLGAQGDFFDAQKDSFLGIAGVMLGLLLTHHHFRHAVYPLGQYRSPKTP